ncbi:MULTISPECIES: H-NS family nucleoid-associated regulatory protein [Paracoccaceae]|jgi:DNA-binding protein H-NS|uniref:H-NS histone family protein n=1 Tax=Rhodobacterales TaxID=204455 RepID=UPI001B0DA3EE|nr:H-NS histone family protein [Boseongicola sp. H5]MBO6922939.1 H-NS histone family protein [Roseicyclus sp.]
MSKLNLEKLTVKELRQLQRDAAKAIAGYEDRKRAEAIAELEAVAQKHGYKLSDLVSGKKATKTASPAKYRHPENPAMTWTGRGRQPNWIKEGLAAGKSLGDFAI